jgi:Flp pilus assembly protein TadG
MSALMGLKAIGRMKRWLLQENEEPRRTPRSAGPEVVVYYWDGSAPEGRHLRDISSRGAYIYTPERWYPGTIIRIVLQGYPTTAGEGAAAKPVPSACIPARVVRQGPDGVGVEFAFLDKEEEEAFRAFLAAIPAQPERAVAGKTTSGQGGQALVEFALILPLVFLLAVNAVNFGGFFFAWITVAGAARSGVQYMSMSSASPGAPPPATAAMVSSLIASDTYSLLNKSSIVVATCTNNTASAGCGTLPDPEAPAYTLAAVDVTYTYKPFIPLFPFTKLGIGATLPSGTIHRKAVMRMLQ